MRCSERGSFRPPIIFFSIIPRPYIHAISLSLSRRHHFPLLLGFFSDPHLFLPLSKPVGLFFSSHSCFIMVDIKLSPLMPESSWAFSPHETFFKQISSCVAGWIAAVRSPVLVNISNKAPDLQPEISGPWDRLMASSPPQPHSLAAFTAGKFTHQKGALMNSLLVRLIFNTSSLKIKTAYSIVLQEFAPCLGKYHPARCKSVHVHHQRGSVSSTDTQVCPFTFPVLLCYLMHELTLLLFPATLYTDKRDFGFSVSVRRDHPTAYPHHDARNTHNHSDRCRWASV